MHRQSFHPRHLVNKTRCAILMVLGAQGYWARKEMWQPARVARVDLSSAEERLAMSGGVGEGLERQTLATSEGHSRVHGFVYKAAQSDREAPLYWPGPAGSPSRVRGFLRSSLIMLYVQRINSTNRLGRSNRNLSIHTSRKESGGVIRRGLSDKAISSI
jgi:hypothetical protein